MLLSPIKIEFPTSHESNPICDLTWRYLPPKNQLDKPLKNPAKGDLVVKTIAEKKKTRPPLVLGAIN